MIIMRVLCFSKWLVLVSWLVTGVLTSASVLAVFLVSPERDLTPLVTITGLSWAETATATGFYYWKARAENRIKLTKAMVDDWAEKYGISAVVDLARIVLPD